MRSDWMTRIVRPTAALVILALVLVFLGLALTATPADAQGVGVQSDGQVVEFGKDIVVGPDQHAKGAAAFGGDIAVAGTVQQSVVAFGGDITVSGTVQQSVVAFGGDIRLLPTAVVGGGMKANDATVVSVGGTITREPGAQVTGQTKQVSGKDWSSAIGAIGSTSWSSWFGWSFAGWLVQTAIFLVLALVAAALMPKQLLAVQRHLSARPAASLGWGALTFFVIVPVTLVVLIISVIGILLAIPLAVFVLLAYFFATTGVAALLAQKVLSGAGKQNLMLAVAVGVVGTTLVSRIPVAGGIALLAMTVFGVGAGVLAFGEWRRERKPAVAPAGPTGGPGGPGGAYPVAPAPGAAAIEPAGAPAGPAGQTCVPTIPPSADENVPASESGTAVQALSTEPGTVVQAAPDEPPTTVRLPEAEATVDDAALAVGEPPEAPEPPAGPAAPDASQLPTPSSHQPLAAQPPGNEA